MRARLVQLTAPLLPIALLAVAASLGGCTTSRVAVPDDGEVPQGVEAYAAAVGALNFGEPEEAVSAIADLVLVEPWWVPAHVVHQDALALSGRSDFAREFYGAQAEAHRDDARRVLLDARLRPAGDSSREAGYRRAVELAPESPWPTLALAFELARAAQTGARSAVERADTGDAEGAARLRSLGSARLDEALSLAASAAERWPYLAESHSVHAEALLAAGTVRRDRAAVRSSLTAAERAVELDPGNPRRHARLARVRRELIDDTGAEEALRSALRLSPQSADLQAGLGRVLLDLGRPAEALDVLSAAAAARPSDAEIVADLGVALHRVGDPVGAEAALARAAAIDPGDERIQVSLRIVRASLIEE